MIDEIADDSMRDVMFCLMNAIAFDIFLTIFGMDYQSNLITKKYFLLLCGGNRSKQAISMVKEQCTAFLHSLRRVFRQTCDMSPFHDRTRHCRDAGDCHSCRMFLLLSSLLSFHAAEPPGSHSSEILFLRFQQQCRVQK